MLNPREKKKTFKKISEMNVNFHIDLLTIILSRQRKSKYSHSVRCVGQRISHKSSLIPVIHFSALSWKLFFFRIFYRFCNNVNKFTFFLPRHLTNNRIHVLLEKFSFEMAQFAGRWMKMKEICFKTLDASQ